MIVRDSAAGGALMITQNDHALLSGFIAAHWGNETFERPSPYGSVVRAASFHDRGWIDYETSPRLFGASRPPNYRDVPTDAAQLRAFKWASDWLGGIDPYAGLLSAKHRSGLYSNRYDVIAEPPLTRRGALPETLRSFVAASEDEQADRQAAYSQDQVMTNYRLLQVWDLMSLHLCGSDAPGAIRIGPAPLNYAGEAAVLSLRPVAARTFAVTPYPFDVDALEAGLTVRRLAAREFASDDALQEAYFKAPLQTLDFTFVRAGADGDVSAAPSPRGAAR